MKRTFDLRAVLSVTTGRLLTKRISERDNGIGALYEILNWMTDDNLYTHQLPRAMQQCAPHLVRLFPELDVAESRLAELDASLGNAADPGRVVAEWIDSLGLKAEYDIPQIPIDDRSHVDPYVELVAMRGGTDGIVVVDEGPELLQIDPENFM